MAGKHLRNQFKPGALFLKIICGPILFLMLTIHVFAASLSSEIKGQVMDMNNKPIPNATVKAVNSAVSVMTDIQGKFSINAGADDMLMITAIGYKTKTVSIGGEDNLSIFLEQEAQNLDEIVVIAYGTQKRSDLTSAISTVKGDQIQKVATNNPVNALQGQVAGLSVTSPGGNPGQSSDVQLRGIGTFGGHQPLYIIDGTPGNPYYLSNNDIASIEVLKDGAAASIYGSNSANGVILITTKKGKKGEPLIDFNSYYGVTHPTKKYQFLDAEGYKKLHRMMYENAGITSLPDYITTNTNVNDDWQDLVSRNGSTQNYNLTLSGGGDYLTYALSGDYSDEIGTFIGSKFNKKGIRSVNELKKGILTVTNNFLYSETRSEAYKFDLTNVYFQSPLLPVYDENEKYGYGLTVNGLPKFENAIGADHFNENYFKTQYLSEHLKIRLQLMKGLSYTANLSYITSHDLEFDHHPPFRANANDPAISYPYVYNMRSNYKEQLMEHLLNYDFTIDKHKISLLAGYSAQQKTNEFLSATADGKTIVRTVVNGGIVEKEVTGGFTNPDFNTISAGLGGTFNASGSNNKYTRLSTFGRVNYSYDNKYLLQLSARRDGSSVFGLNNRYGVFPSVSAGWNVSRESFFDVQWINNLKIRGSYGELGNEGALGYYDHQGLITTSNRWSGGYVQGSGSSPWPGSASYSLENRDLKWETSKSTNLGIDFAILNNKLSGTINYFNNKTEGLLIIKEVPPSAGVNNPILNVGKIANKGVELELNYLYQQKDLTINVGGNVSYLKNEVLALADADQTLYGEGLKFGSDHIPTQTKVGKEIGGFYLYETDGIFQSDSEASSYKNKGGDALQPDAKAGDIRFKDTNGDGIIDENDKTYQGSGFPKFSYGLNIAANYKQFDISIFFQGVSGNKIYNGNRFELEGMDAGRNFLTTTLNAWTPQNTNTSMPRAVLGDPNWNARESTRFLEDGSYLRLKLLQVGYTLPNQITNSIKMNKVRIYVSGQNILTFTKYTGLDPEVAGINVLNTGVDRTLYPQNKKWIAGLQITL